MNCIGKTLRTLLPGIAVTLLTAVLPGIAGAQSAASLTINGCSSLTYAGGTTFTCVPTNSTPAPGAPTGCSVSASPGSLSSAGGTVSLSAGCTGGTVSNTTWTRNGSAFSASSTDTLPGNSGTSQATYTYAVTFCADTAKTLCTSASATVTVAAGSVSPAPPPTSASCGSLRVIEPYMEANAAQRQLVFTGDRFVTAGFGSNASTIVVAEIPVPAGIAGPTTLAIFEYGTAATSRKAWLSKTRCDTSAASIPYRMVGNGPVFDIQIGGAPDSNKVNMQPGETWYLMIKNEKMLSTGDSCSSGGCDIGIKLYRP